MSPYYAPPHGYGCGGVCCCEGAGCGGCEVACSPPLRRTTQPKMARTTMTTAATTIICSRDMCYLTLSPFSLDKQSAKEKGRARGRPYTIHSGTHCRSRGRSLGLPRLANLFYGSAGHQNPPNLSDPGYDHLANSPSLRLQAKDGHVRSRADESSRWGSSIPTARYRQTDSQTKDRRFDRLQ